MLSIFILLFCTPIVNRFENVENVCFCHRVLPFHHSIIGIIFIFPPSYFAVHCQFEISFAQYRTNILDSISLFRFLSRIVRARQKGKRITRNEKVYAKKMRPPLQTQADASYFFSAEQRRDFRMRDVQIGSCIKYV